MTLKTIKLSTVSPAEYDRIQYKQALMESIARGVADSNAGKLKSAKEAKRAIEAARADRKSTK